MTKGVACGSEILSIQARLRRYAEEKGYGIAWGDAGIIAEVKNEIVRKRDAGMFDEGFYKTMLGAIAKSIDFASEGTVITVAVPRPAHLLPFDLGDRVVEAVMPPTYIDYATVMGDVRQDLEALLAPYGVETIAAAPLKSLAVRLGLAKYGRMNVTFTESTGCYHELAAYWSPVDLGTWPGEQSLETVMPECAHCAACIAACPTGALNDDRFVLHAERCITFANESSGDWPEFVKPGQHTALIGCMHCIQACPKNRGRLAFERAPISLDRAETEALLSDSADPNDPTWQSIADKLKSIGYVWLKASLGRNLRALLR